MDYKKKYKEALERARAINEGKTTGSLGETVSEYIFPELKESEDEKVRKELIEHIKANKEEDYVLFKKFSPDDVIAWLEKQGKERKITHEEICKSYGIPDIGEFSDGYHTFNGLYKQRMILFAVLVKTYKDRAWKSWKHEDGLDCFGGGWFIVGIDTPDGTYTYHYEAKDWDRFDCQVLEKAKHWDGHDEYDVERLFSLVDNVNKDEVIRCLINGMKFYYEDNEEATWGTEKFSMKVKDILAWLEKQKEPELSEDLGEYIAELSKQFPEVSFAKLSRIAVRVKNWLEKYGEANTQYWRGYREGKQEVLDKYAELKKQGEHKFNIGDIISNGKVEFRVDNIVKNAIGQDCYFLVNVEMEKNGKRYLPMYSRGKTSYMGETTWLCEQVDAEFEKQGEQKLADKVEPKFHQGEWITNGDYTWKIIEVKPLDYILQSQDGNIVDDTISHVDEQFHSFTIEDAKDGDVLVYGDNPDSHHIEIIMLFKAQRNEGSAFTFFHIFDNDYRVIDWCDCGKSVHPADKTQRDTLFAKMKEAGYEWDAEKKELKKIESTNKVEPFDKYEGLTDFERTLADICIGWIGEELGWKQYIKDNADVLLKIAIKKFNSVQDASFEQKLAWSEEDKDMVENILGTYKTLEDMLDLSTEQDQDILTSMNFEKDWLKQLKQRIGG